MTTIPIRNICCIGAGYVGGPTMAVIADHCPYIQINVVDLDKERIAAWNDVDLRKLPVFEPGLDELIKRNSKQNRLKFSSDIENSIKKSDIIFICVGTPTNKSTNSADLKYVFNVEIFLFTDLGLIPLSNKKAIQLLIS